MARQSTCPNCGHQFASPAMVGSAYQVYLHVVVNGMSNVAYARKSGLAPSTVTLYRRLGLALAIGVDPESDLFVWLGNHAGANSADVAAAIEAPGATPESIGRVARQHMEPGAL